MSSLPQLTLKEGLEIWSRNKDVSCAAEGAHFSLDELLRLVEPGAMAKLSEERKEHLSRCSDCLQKWLDMSEEQDFIEDLQDHKTSDDWYSGGMMEAASSELTSAVALKSRCGNFQLGLYPDGSRKGEGMISLEYIGSSGPDVEGKTVTVRDLNGLVLLDGSIRAGRIASISKEFATIDLQAWSVHVHGETEEDKA